MHTHMAKNLFYNVTCCLKVHRSFTHSVWWKDPHLLSQHYSGKLLFLQIPDLAFKLESKQKSNKIQTKQNKDKKQYNIPLHTSFPQHCLQYLKLSYDFKIFLRIDS